MPKHTKAEKVKKTGGGIFSQGLRARELKEKDVRRRVQQETTTKARGKVAKVEMAKAKKKRGK